MQQRYPQIVGFHFVSSFTGQVSFKITGLLADERVVSLLENCIGPNCLICLHVKSWSKFEKNPKKPY